MIGLPVSLVMAWLAITMLAVTAACMIAVTAGAIRGRLRALPLFGWLLVVSLVVPFVLLLLVILLAAEPFDLAR
jgi:hypothetical protein